jgi:hypothetical protein
MIPALASLAFGIAGALALASLANDLRHLPSTFARLASEARQLD